MTDVWVARIVAVFLGLAALYSLYLADGTGVALFGGALAGFLAGVPLNPKKD